MAKLGRPFGSKTAYRELVNTLKMEIKAGRLSDGALLPSRLQMARRYKVSEKVVRLALNDLKAQGLLIRTAKNRWKVGSFGVAISSRTNLVAMVVAHPFQSHHKNILLSQLHRGIELAMAKQWDPLLIIQGNYHVIARHLPPDLVDEQLLGVLLVGTFTRECLLEYAKLSVPVVLVDTPPGKLKLRSVCMDNAQATEDAMQRMVALGHRRIAFCRRIRHTLRAVDPDSQERYQAFVESARRLKLHSREAVMFNFFPDPKYNESALASIFSERQGFTAILAVDANIAGMVADSAKSHGLHIGRDVSLACYDAIKSPSPWAGPRMDFESMGHIAVEMLGAKGTENPVCRIPCTWHEAPSLAAAKR